MSDENEKTMNAETTAENPTLSEAMGEDQTASAAERVEAELAETKDRLLRLAAEMENLRRRTQREVEEGRKYATTNFARGLLDVADNLARALASVPPEERERNEFIKNLVLGVEMTERTLQGLFEKNEIAKVVPEKGEKFDHNVHQAMFEVPSADRPSGTIAEVLQPGYVIAGRLLRPALVGVTKSAPRPTQPESNVDQQA
ncbi:molecular chaperone GrpE [Arboricoccus pini]|uniref:Protein GrpE n=1 Tax=Arboricoccus pini TaxID=1963835 RepID=A0A212RD27_9PROT|nr:nucleotide exchange factor GrpE [Arboricoccus pini]SNB70191.1 molecular chaperone GrpE [Arboricoccus pini]